MWSTDEALSRSERSARWAIKRRAERPIAGRKKRWFTIIIIIIINC
jgi:hypothetical protein